VKIYFHANYLLHHLPIAFALLFQKVKILEFDRENWKIRARGYGEPFDLAKHPQGTEVKAITYSNMQVHEDPDTGKCEVFVIIDI
jgi:SHS2 domain-containing protein